MNAARSKAKRNRTHGNRQTIAGRRPAARLWLPVLIVGALLAAYSNSFDGAFVFDDDTAIVSNPALRSSSALTAAFGSPRDTTLAGRPVTALTFAFNYATGELNPTGYHALNLAIHALAALMLFAVGRRTFEVALPADTPQGQTSSLALVVAAIWAVHPLTTSAVTYIVQRAESLASLLYLLTLYCAIRSLSSAHRLWTAASIAACAAGMATKEMMVTAPVMVACWDLLFVSGTRRAVLTRRWPFYLALAATWIVLAALLATSPRSASVGFGLNGIGPAAYLLTQAGVVAHYLRLVFAPWPLSIDYEWPIASSLWDVMPQAALVLTLLGISLWGFIKRAPWSFQGVWFFGILAPTSTVVPIVTEIAAGHRMYLPAAGVIAAVVVCAWALIQRVREIHRSRLQRSGLMLAAAVALVSISATRARNEDYESAERLYRTTVAHQPANARALNNLATLLLERSEPAEAEGHLRRALAVRPEYPQAQSNLGIALAMQGRSDEAIPLFAEAVRREPAFIDAWRNYGEALASAGRFAEALPAYSRVLDQKPDDVRLLQTIAWILATAPQPETRDGARARSLAERALTLPGGSDARGHDIVAAALAEGGSYQESVRTAERALQLAQGAGQRELAADISYRLELYRRGRPYRETPGAGR